jgi:hypothetical protein
MAFTGAAVFANLGSRALLITGLSLAAGADGTLGDNGDATADVQLPATFPAISATETWTIINEIAGGSLQPITFTIAGPPNQVVINNNDGVNATGGMEIRLINPHSVIR